MRAGAATAVKWSGLGAALNYQFPKSSFSKAPSVSLTHFLAPSATNLRWKRHPSAEGPLGAHPRNVAVRPVTSLCLHQAGSCPPPLPGHPPPPYTGPPGSSEDPPPRPLRARRQTDQKGVGVGTRPRCRTPVSRPGRHRHLDGSGLRPPRRRGEAAARPAMPAGTGEDRRAPPPRAPWRSRPPLPSDRPPPPHPRCPRASR